MPTKQQLAKLIQQNPDMSDDEILALASGGGGDESMLRKTWNALTRPIVGEQGYLGVGLPRVQDPGMAGKVYNTVADFGEAMTSPLDFATLGAGMGAKAAGKAGLMGLSRLAKAAEIGGIGSYGVAGAAQAVADPTLANVGAAALQGGLSALGVRGAAAKMRDRLVARGEGERLLDGTFRLFPERRVNVPGSQPADAALGLNKGQLSPEMDEMVRQQMAAHQAGGGSTFNPRQGNMAGQDFYSVGGVVPSTVIPSGEFSEEALRAFLLKNQDALKDPSRSVGTWLNEGNVHLDITDLLPREQALARAAERGEKAIFGLKNFDEVFTPSPRPGIGLNQANAFVGPALAVGSDPIAQMVPGLDEEQRQKLSTALKVGGAGLAMAPLAAAWANRYGGFAGKSIYKTPLGLEKTDRAVKTLATERTSALLRGAVDEFDQQLVSRGMTPEQLTSIKDGSANLLEAHTKHLVAKRPFAEMLNDFHAGKGGSEWYEKVGDYFKQNLGEKDAEMFTRFVAATSVNATVKANMSLALRAFSEWKAGLDFVKKPTARMKQLMPPDQYAALEAAWKNRAKGQKGFLPSVVDELNRAKAGQAFEGRKIENFARAMAGDPNAIVVDRWMMRWAGFPPTEKWGAADDPIYDIIEDMVRKAAAQMGVTPRQMQAAIWKGTRDRLGITEEKTGKVLRKEFGGSYDELLQDPSYPGGKKWKKIVANQPK